MVFRCTWKRGLRRNEISRPVLKTVTIIFWGFYFLLSRKLFELDVRGNFTSSPNFYEKNVYIYVDKEHCRRSACTSAIVFSFCFGVSGNGSIVGVSIRGLLHNKDKFTFNFPPIILLTERISVLRNYLRRMDTKLYYRQ